MNGVPVGVRAGAAGWFELIRKNRPEFPVRFDFSILWGLPTLPLLYWNRVR